MATKKRPATKQKKKVEVKARAKTKVKAKAKAKANKPRAARKRIDPGDERVARIQRVIDLMVVNGAVEVEMEEAGQRLRVRLKEDVRAATIVAHPPAPSHPEVIPAPAPGPAPGPGAPASPAEEEAAQGEVFPSPMVGTFYRAPAPEAEPFVEVGDRVTAETILCVIEAMKVMNEIKAEAEGQIAAILVENGEPVEYGQPLFRITA